MDLLNKYGKRFGLAVGLLSLADILFLAMRILLTGTGRYTFVFWNLALAWIAPLISVLLVRNLARQRWDSSRNIVLSLLWLIFLPNTWYVLTDFIHVYPNGEISQLYDIVLVMLLVLCGFMLGFASLFLIHREFIKRFSSLKSYLIVEGAILISSFAIYLGRDLRWNSWDVIKNPGGVLVNVSDRIADPFGSPRAFNVTILFFILISALYLAIWVFTQPAPSKRR